MARPEPKLRPSISVSEMILLSKVLDSEIRRRIQVGDKGLETLQVAKLKEYVDSFKPAEVVLPDLLAKYADNSSVVEHVEFHQVNQETSVSVLNDSSLTDEQKYDLLLLEDSKKYSPEETAFMNLTGFSIKMQRMAKASVKEDEL